MDGVLQVDAFVDSEEDEVFFGDRSEKEDQGFKKRNLKAVRRTVQLGHAKSAKPLVKPMSSIEEDDHCSELPDKENGCARSGHKLFFPVGCSQSRNIV